MSTSDFESFCLATSGSVNLIAGSSRGEKSRFVGHTTSDTCIGVWLRFSTTLEQLPGLGFRKWNRGGLRVYLQIHETLNLMVYGMGFNDIKDTVQRYLKILKYMNHAIGFSGCCTFVMLLLFQSP